MDRSGHVHRPATGNRIVGRASPYIHARSLVDIPGRPLAHPTMSDRREFTRVPLAFPVRIHAEGRTLDGSRSIDVSANGVAVTTSHQLPVGTACEIELCIAESRAMEATGHVVRSSDGALAVEITEMELESYELMRNLLRFNADDPDRIEAEFCQHVGIRRN